MGRNSCGSAESALSQPQSHTVGICSLFCPKPGTTTSQTASHPFAFSPSPRSAIMAPSFDTLTEQDLHEEEEEEIDFSGE